MAKKTSQTFTTGKFSTALIIPIDIARKNGLDNHATVIVEDTENGILVRKIEL